MTAFARGLAEAGVHVVTFNFLYLEERRKVPDRTPVLEGCFRAVIEAARARADLTDTALFLGGKSMGGRMATHLGAQGVERLQGLVALGYPLHPPGKPEQLRAAHLTAIRVPLLVVQGERDAFGTPAELEPVLARLGGDVTVHVVAGGDHSLAVRGQTPSQVYAPVIALIAGWIRARAT
jgi:predicted alpha/beta-hydrolase family hydrolase